MSISKENLISFLSSSAIVVGIAMWCVGFPAYRDYTWSSSTIADKQRSGWQVASTMNNFINPGHFWTFVRTPITQIGFVRPDDITLWGKFAVTRVLWANYNYEKSEERIAVEVFDCEQKRLARAPENLATDSKEARDQKLAELEWNSYTDDQPGAQNLKYVCDEISKNPRHSEIEYTEEEMTKVAEFLKDIDRNLWDSDRKIDFRSFMQTLTSRNNRKITRLEADDLVRALQTMLDFRDEATRVLLETWDNGKRPSTERLEILERSVLEALGDDRKADTQDYKDMINAAEKRETTIVFSDGIKRDFNRKIINDLGFRNQVFRQNTDTFRSIINEFVEK